LYRHGLSARVDDGGGTKSTEMNNCRHIEDVRP
jgi:hypothetical protein